MLRQFSWNSRIIFHSSEDSYVSRVVCEECTVYYFIVWDSAQSIFVCRWCVLKWWYYLHLKILFLREYYEINRAFKNKVGHTSFFSNQCVTFFFIPKKNVTFLSVLFTMVIFLEKCGKMNLCIYSVAFIRYKWESFLLLPTLPPYY